MVRIWIAGGGTGGHVYPGLAVLQALRTRGPMAVLYVGGADSIEERLVERAGLQFAAIPAGGMHGLAPWRAAWNFIRLMRGFLAALALGRRERPQALFVTGGYASVPVALAARILRVPILLYLPDIEPGRAVRFIARLASCIGVTTEASRDYFPADKTVLTGYPVRTGFGELDRTSARDALGLDPDERTVLFLGGSRGARSINQALIGVLEAMLQEAQLIHVTGELDWPWVAERAETLAPGLRARYHAYPYLHEVGQALAAADLAVCRAGASVLGELPIFGLPAILVPYPYAWRYQRTNARWVEERGAAIVLEDADLGSALLPTVRDLLADGERLDRMRERSQALARPDAAERLAERLWALATAGAEEAGQ